MVMLHRLNFTMGADATTVDLSSIHTTAVNCTKIGKWCRHCHGAACRLILELDLNNKVLDKVTELQV